jgi:lysozyme family protein
MHPEPVDTNPQTTTTIDPLGCDGQTYFYRITLTVTDAAGASTTKEVRLYPNCSGTNQAPAVSITSPANSASFTAAASITITANATDDGTVSRVEFYNGATKLGEDLTSPYSYSWSNVAAGSYSLTAKAFDNAGASTTSSVVNITVNGTTTACSGTGSISREVWTNITGKAVSTIPVNTAPTSTGVLSSFEAPINQGDNYGQRIRGYLCVATSGSYVFYIASDDDAELYLSTDADPAKKTRIAYVSGWTNAREWTKSLTQKSAAINLQAGVKYYIEALHKDDIYGDHLSVGWQSSSTAAITVIAGANLSAFTTSTPGNQAPAVSITTPANNASFTAPASVTINATATDDGSISRVEFYNGATKLGEDLTAPYSFTWSNVAAGSYSLTARAFDNAGASTTSSAVNISVGAANQPPTVSITSPSSGAVFTAPASVVINATAADANGTVSRVEFYNGQTKLGEDLTSPYSYNWSNVAAGSYSLTAKAFDNAGASTTSSVVNVTVKLSTPSGQSLVSFTLINADTDKEIGLLTEGYVINFANIGTKKLNVRANTNPATVGSVVFNLDRVNVMTDNVAPYALKGNNGTNYNPWTPSIGAHTLKATPYSGANASGIQGTAFTVNFSVVSSTARIDFEQQAMDEINGYIHTFPNPFSNLLTIEFALPETEDATLHLYNTNGGLIKVLFTGKAETGHIYKLSLQASDLASGLYMLRLSTKNSIVHKKISLVR